MYNLLLLVASVIASAWAAPVEVHRIVVAPGDTLVATTQGTGSAIVLVPGLLGNAYGFRKITPALADAGYRTIIVEPLGTGNSSRPRHADYTLEAQAARVAATLDQLGVAQAHFVCHSVGASICLRLALQQPERVRGIVSLNGGPDERAGTSGLKAAVKLAPLLKLIGAGRIIRGKVKDGLKKNSVDPQWVTEDVVVAYTRPFRNLDATLRTTKLMGEAVEPDSLIPRLPRITQPVLMLVGTGSPSGAPSAFAVSALARGLRDFRADTIPQAGQYIQEERPEVVVQAVLRFVQQHR